MTRSRGRSTPRSRPVAARRTAASTSTSRRGARREFIRKRLPSMYHQFKELADVDITAEPMEIGPTCHYVMGGVEVDADTQESAVTGLYAVGECSGGMHGSNRLGGNSLGDLLVFGKRAGEAATAYTNSLGERRPQVDEADVKAAQESALAPFEVEGGENPYTIQSDLQQSMNDLVGIIRTAEELEQSLDEIEAFKVRAAVDEGGGPPAVQPGLAPRPRPAQHADRQRGDREGGAGPAGVARRSHPRRLPGAEPRVGHQEPGRQPQRRRHRRGPAREAAAGDAGRAQEVLRGSPSGAATT